MQKRKLGRSNLGVSALGPGCMGMSVPKVSICGVAATVANAIYHATGVRVRDSQSGGECGGAREASGAVGMFVFDAPLQMCEDALDQ